MEVYLILAAFLGLKLVVSASELRKEHRTPEDYFLADRALGPLVLFFTFVATNFSAFFFLGFAGAGYRIGYSYYVMMAAGTTVGALGFFIPTAH